MNKDLTKKLTSLESLIAVQRQTVDNRNPSVDYMHGMLNGLIVAHSVFSETSPIFHVINRRRRDRKVRHKSLHKGYK
jgi:hypothetical protein